MKQRAALRDLGCAPGAADDDRAAACHRFGNDEYERLALEVFEAEVRRLHYKTNTEDGLIFSRALCVALERLFNFPVNSSSADKEVPPQLFEAGASAQWAFLSGLFEGDAYISVVSKNGNSRPPFIEYTTASLKLARQVISLLLRLGVLVVLIPVTGLTVALVAKALARVRGEVEPSAAVAELSAQVSALQDEVESLTAEMRELKAAQEFDRKLLGGKEA